MTIQQLTTGRELINAISENERQIESIRKFMDTYVKNSSDMFEITISGTCVYGEYVGRFSEDDIVTLLNNRIAELEESVKTLKNEFESL